MNPARMVHENAPAFIPVPADLQHRRVEAIFWPLEAEAPNEQRQVAQDQPSPTAQPTNAATPISQLMGKGRGCFEGAADIDAFIRAERDAWAR